MAALIAIVLAGLGEPTTALYSVTTRVFMPLLAVATIVCAVVLAMRQRTRALSGA